MLLKFMKDETVIIGGSKRISNSQTPVSVNADVSMDAVIKNKVITNSSMTDDCKLGKYTVKQIIDAIIAHGITP